MRKEYGCMYITAFCFVDEMFFQFFSFLFCLGGLLCDYRFRKEKKRVILWGWRVGSNVRHSRGLQAAGHIFLWKSVPKETIFSYVSSGIGFFFQFCYFPVIQIAYHDSTCFSILCLCVCRCASVLQQSTSFFKVLDIMYGDLVCVTERQAASVWRGFKNHDVVHQCTRWHHLVSQHGPKRQGELAFPLKWVHMEHS